MLSVTCEPSTNKCHYKELFVRKQCHIVKKFRNTNKIYIELWHHNNNNNNAESSLLVQEMLCIMPWVWNFLPRHHWLMKFEHYYNQHHHNSPWAAHLPSVCLSKSTKFHTVKMVRKHVNLKFNLGNQLLF